MRLLREYVRRILKDNLSKTNDFLVNDLGLRLADSGERTTTLGSKQYLFYINHPSKDWRGIENIKPSIQQWGIEQNINLLNIINTDTDKWMIAFDEITPSVSFKHTDLPQLYHITEDDYVDSILENGIQPQKVSRDSTMFGKGRIYVVASNSVPEDLEDLAPSIDDPVLLKINNSAMANATFYEDTELEGDHAYWTNTFIPPSALEIIE